MSITSDEVNYLVYRYLLESGFTHSTFSFQQETAIHRTDIKGSSVKPGALISLLQKGLHYAEVEAHLNEDGTERRCLAPFTLLGPHECHVLDSFDDEEEDPIRELKKLKRRFAQNHANHGPVDGDQNHTTNTTSTKKERREKSRKGDRSSKTKRDVSPQPEVYERQAQEFDTDVEMAEGAIVSVEIPPELQMSPEHLQELDGHLGEVFVCSWHPTDRILATGSGDGTARIWELQDGETAKSTVLELGAVRSETRDITTLEWSRDGSLLAMGSYAGVSKVWSKDGTLKFTLDKHMGPIFSIKWNKSGTLLLTGSMDKTAIVWDGLTGEARQQFEFHTGPTLDVDWSDDITFVTSSADRQIYVCQLGSLEPLRQFSGHEDEINAIKWDPTGRYLASCSDDHTAKVWSVEQDEPVWDFKDHAKEVYSLKWAPGDRPTLATASFDSTVRIWDIETGSCTHILDRHTANVYSVSFSPDGLYLASGSYDQCVIIWSLKDGSPVKMFRRQGGVFEVAFNTKGNKLAATYSDHKVIVFDDPSWNILSS